MIQKNDEYIITIESMGSEGEGIGRVDGYPLFVKDGAPGDTIKVKVIKTKKTYGYGRLVEVLEPSPFRMIPKCGVAKQCGGCQLQHVSYKQQLAYKEEKVKSCLERIGGFSVVPSEGNEDKVPGAIMLETIIGMEEPYYYRNKAQFPIGYNKENHVVTGFYAARTHSIIETTDCLIQASENKELLTIVRDFLEEFHISVYDEKSHKGLVRHILTRVGFSTKEIMVCLVINGETIPHKEVLIKRLTKVPHMTSICLNSNREKTNVILGNKVTTLWGQPYITDYIGDIKFHISPLSFFQVNPVQTLKLYQQALEYASLQGDEVVWDLYCGIGTISLFLAQKANQVYGVEIVPQAIADAKTNAKINGILNAEFYVGAAEDVVPKKYKEEGIRADVIVVDPPRKGCAESLLDTIVAMAPNKVVYVSCDPATLARDLKYMAGQGYVVEKARPVDMFPHSTHVETVVLMTKCASESKSRF